MNRIIATILSICLISLWTRPAMAYIDPGSGSAIMSAIIGFLIAIGLAIKTYWYKLKSLFVGKRATGVRPEDKDQ